MDEIEKNNFSSIKKALEQIQMLGLSERMNPYHILYRALELLRQITKKSSNWPKQSVTLLELPIS